MTRGSQGLFRVLGSFCLGFKAPFDKGLGFLCLGFRVAVKGFHARVSLRKGF